MSKWRAIQHRHRYTYSAVVFPPHFFEALHQTLSARFYTELKHLISLNSTYAQLTHAKNIASAFTDMLSDPSNDVESIYRVSKLYMEILFLENSMPLYRTLVSVFSKAKNFQDLIVKCFRELCEEYGGENGKGRRFSVCRVALLIMGTPKLGYMSEVVEECAILVGLDVVSGLNSVLLEVGESARPSPLVMEQCQEALSCTYYLLQRYPEKFRDSDGGFEDTFETIFTTILSILNSEGFSRDCLVAAGVSLCAALQVCLSPEELGLFTMEGVFNHTPIVSGGISLNVLLDRIPLEGKVIEEIHRFSSLSRLCLIRGILTAVPREVLNSVFVILNGCEGDIASSGDGRRSVKTILYDGILPELCNYCENPIDSHFNFHALTVMQMCLQQIKTSIQCNIGENTEDSDLISESMGARILRIMWNNLEDPLSQTVKQVHLIFDLYLYIQGSLHVANGIEKNRSFMMGIASDLLRLGPRCKGRYIPLALLTKRLGAKTLLGMKPHLLFETTEGYVDDDVCSAATNFLKCFLECLRDEYWNSDGVENGYTKYRGLCLPPFVDRLSSGVPKLRTNLNTYALPVLLGLDEDSIFSLLASLGVQLAEGASEIVYPDFRSMDESAGAEHQVAVLVSLLKVARALALIEGDLDWYENFPPFSEKLLMSAENNDIYALVCIKGIKVKIPVRWLLLALTHTDDALRIDAAETLFLNPKSASLPSSLELKLMKDAVPLNMRCSSTAFQMKWSSLFRKFFSRVRTALEKQFKLGNWQPLESKNHTTVLPSDEIIGERAWEVFNFMRWLSCFLFLSCYPSAPYERKIMAMELILIMLGVWSMMNPLQGNDKLFSANTSLYPYGSWFTLPESALLFVGSIVDSWDRLRESSFQILLHFPTPLPGIHSPDMVKLAIIWAKRLVCSPRVRESDAGALTLRLIFRKYVVDLGWVVRPSSNSVSSHLQPELSNGDLHNTTQCSPVIEYIRSLIDWLLLSIEEGEKDLSEACKDSFVHGILLALRYTFEELDWSSDVVLSSVFEMKLALDKLLELVMRITSLALGVVSADAWHLPDGMEDDIDDFALEVVVETGATALMQEDGGNTTKYVRDVRPSEQIVMVGCWLAMKEVSLLLGTIIRKIPLPTSDVSDMRMQDIEKDCASSVASDAMLDLKQLQIIGNHFLEVILKMKHMGAIDKTRAGFTALCNRLLSSDDSRLCKLTESWMEQLMERMEAKGQTVDDVLRRSAGIPAAFSAFFLSEPEGTPKRLLPRALRWLIDIAKKPLADQESENSPGAVICNFSTNLNEVHQLEPMLTNDNENISKIRDEGVVPTVHAFNVLRATFNDTNLATDTSGFSAEAMIIAIRSFSSSYWEVRNGACLAYTALVRRMIGFLNVQKRESVRRALTGLEFFHRYPLLHTFLLSELRVATEMLTNGSSEHLGANMKNAVHPSLCPMLILLSRLKPSAIASNAGDALDPALFMPFIRRCSIQSNYKIRVLASRALTGLVSNEKLPLLLLNIVSEIPSGEDMGFDLPSSLNLTRFSYNSVHGMLLQLNALLDTNCRNLADTNKKDTILADLIDVLVSRSWIGTPHKCGCPILSTCLLQVLDNMLSISKSCELKKTIDAIRKILLELTSECLETGKLLGPSYYDPTLTELRRQAVTSFFNCVRGSPKEVTEEDVTWTTDLSKASEMDVSSPKFKEKLLGCMSDASYEVRIAALKWLFAFLKETKPIGDNSGPKCEVGKVLCSSIGLQSVLTKLLSEEKNKKCTYYILKILYSWNLLSFQLEGQHTSETRFVENMNHDSVFQFWDQLVSLYKMTRHTKTRQALICCLGVCVKRISGIFLSFISLDKTSNQSTEYTHFDPVVTASLYDRINYFVDLIKEHGNAAEPVNMRRAAAESLAASGLLDQAQALGCLVSNICMHHQKQYSRFNEEEGINMYAHRVLDLWLMSIKLLEDEDEELRRQLALDMQKLVVIKNCKIGSSPTGVVPSQVEKVIEMSVAHLSSIFGHWVDYIDFLCHWVLSAANSANYDASVGDLVRRVFDKEIDNHHEEKLLICQICCYHLEKLPLTKSSTVDFCDRGQIMNFLGSWRERFCQQLTTFVNDHVGEQGEGMDWIGGVGNHKDAFLPIYANLLAIHALSNCLSHDQETENGDYSISGLIELGQLIRPFIRNPQIGNLYKLIVKSHKYVFGSVVPNSTANSSEDFGVWDEFDPYFLLR